MLKLKSLGTARPMSEGTESIGISKFQPYVNSEKTMVKHTSNNYNVNFTGKIKEESVRSFFDGARKASK